ncbi:MAG TPA: glycosyltransferase family 2 protein [Oligoflexus sp.]|uniref:glycosyltransferase family 2 protein n=1 Tax=Oligoflexus sp. TaxID=1971216 RepID=UPI002D3402E3|nr:glycosyltransferase family 2 protein [Oligoflexus sp.]HYX34686.1 glycosyltransferase family 2 protein [Oligoflexus sp.]
MTINEAEKVSNFPNEKILVFIPVYNCQQQIPRVLAQFKSLTNTFYGILIVDNRSTDASLEVAKTAAQNLALPVTILLNRENLGLGGSHKVAFQYAIDHGYDYCAVLHGDDQGNIHDLVAALDAGWHRTHDCLLGARFMRGSQLQGYSRLRTLGNRIFNWIFSAVSGRRLYDLGSGLNLYRVSRLQKSRFAGFANNLTFNYYLILASVQWQWNIKFFPISWREDDQISNVRLFRQTRQICAILFDFCCRRNHFLHSNNSGRAYDSYQSDTVYSVPMRAAIQ